ncbi:MAG: hypothetical protein KGH98_01335 [Candidatus Micrarchaeota archaeon]|nr:hypothetical protein [Candidatus Micrarchaeota archaeon]
MEEDSHHAHQHTESSASNDPHHAAEHAAHAHEHHAQHHPDRMSSFFDIKVVLIVLAILILVTNVFMRTGLSKYQGLFEPDGFYYYSVIQQTIANHFAVPAVSALSGFPNHIPRAEQPGLIYVTILPYMFLSWTGVSALSIMIWITVAYALAQTVIAFFLAKELFNSNKLGLLAMFFTSVSSGAVARGAATVYRGDSFTTIFLMVSLLLLIYAYKDENRRAKLVKYALSGLFLGLGYLVWTGSPFIVAVYMLAVALMAIWGFIRADQKVLGETLLALGALLISYILDLIFLEVGLSKRILPLQGPEFFLFFIPIAVFAFLAMKMSEGLSSGRSSEMLNSLRHRNSRALAAVIMVVVFIGIVALLLAPEINSLIGVNAPAAGNQTAKTLSQQIVQTTQEQQPPDYNFLFASFNVQLYLAPIGVVLFALLGGVLEGKRWSEKRLHITVAFLALFSFLLITGYTQSTAIRFNALLAMPMAIFAAYGVYALGRLFYGIKLPPGIFTIIAAAAIVAFVAYAIYANVYTLITDQAPVIMASGLVIAGALIAAVLYAAKSAIMKQHIEIRYIFYAAVLSLLVVNFYNVWAESVTSQQADGINPMFLGAMQWMANNTPSNSTVLALWPDGSVVEGWAHRQSYMDSVGGENRTRIYNFAQYLFNTTPDAQYLNGIGRPDYIVARTFWFNEYAGIAQEGLINNSAFNFIRVDNKLTINTTATQATYHFYSFSPPYFQAVLLLSNEKNGTGFLASIGNAQSNRFDVISHLLFYDVDNGQYSIFNSTLNNTLNYTLMVSYTVSQSGQRNITDASILGPGLVQSNIFRLAYLCNFNECPVNQPNSSVTVTPVYINGDTKIYRYNYATA